MHLACIATVLQTPLTAQMMRLAIYNTDINQQRKPC